MAINEENGYHHNMSGSASAPAQASATRTIHRNMRVVDILALLPECEELLFRYGLSCTRCALSPLETIEEGCQLHGFQENVINDLLTDLNLLLSERPARAAHITVTQEAAQMLQGILEQEGKIGWTLSVTVDGHGGFCMDFVEQPDAQEKIFTNAETPGVRVAASPLTLSRIGGATIDVRDGRFKLDLPENSCTGNATCGKGCGCGATTKAER